jgi:hypothetical protein
MQTSVQMLIFISSLPQLLGTKVLVVVVVVSSSANQTLVWDNTSQ